MICLTQFMPRLTGREGKNVMIRKLRFTVGVLTLSCLGVFVPSMVLAQHGPGRHVAGKQEPPAYDANSEATFNGTVSDVTTGPAAETQLFLNTDTGAIRIQLGPTAFLTERKVEIRKGDRLQVTGARVTIGDTQIVLAREITEGRRDVDASGRRRTAALDLWPDRSARVLDEEESPRHGSCS